MTGPVQALGGAVFEGAVSIREAAPRSMITLKGDLDAAPFRKAVKKVTGLELPGIGLGQADGETGVFWMAPDELLLSGPRADRDRMLADLDAALSGTHHLAADVSDARSVFLLDGEGAELREVLARLTPADLHPHSFPPGTFRRTRLAQVAAAIWLREDGAAEVIAFRSVSAYVFGLLRNAASGESVGHF